MSPQQLPTENATVVGIYANPDTATLNRCADNPRRHPRAHPADLHPRRGPHCARRLRRRHARQTRHHHRLTPPEVVPDHADVGHLRGPHSQDTLMGLGVISLRDIQTDPATGKRMDTASVSLRESATPPPPTGSASTSSRSASTTPSTSPCPRPRSHSPPSPRAPAASRSPAASPSCLCWTPCGSRRDYDALFSRGARPSDPMNGAVGGNLDPAIW